MKVSRLADGRWEFDSGEVGGARVRRIFKTQADAEALLRKAKEARKRDGEKLLMDWLSLDASEIREIVEYRREMVTLNGKPDWEKGRELHLAHLRASKSGGRLDALLEAYIARKRKAGRNGAYVDRLERELAAFIEKYPRLTAADVTDTHIDSFLDAQGLAHITRSNRIRDLKGLFSFAKKRNLCIVNPADLVEPVKIIKKRAQVFSVEEVAVILYVADIHPELELVPYLSCGLYGSARVSEAFRLDWQDFILEERALVLEAAATKVNQERVSEDLPPVLIDWIRPYHQEKGPISPSESTVEWRRAHYLVPEIQKILPDFNWKRNALRKTSISATYAVTGDVKATATKHGTSPDIIFKNYRAVMRKAEAARYFELTRQTVFELLKGLIPEEERQAWHRKHQA